MLAIKRRKKRVPKLAFTKNRNLGWHVSYRDTSTGLPRKHRFGMVPRETAELAYHQWVADHLQGRTPRVEKARRRSKHRKLTFGVDPTPVVTTTASSPSSVPPDSSSAGVTEVARTKATVLAGSLLHVGSGLLKFEEGRARKYGEARREGSIHPEVLVQRKQYLMDFLEYLNDRYGKGAVGRMMLADLTMSDVEEYNRAIVKAGFSSSAVTKRLQIIKNLIDRAGRPEYGGQLLGWNWSSRDVLHGTPSAPLRCPSISARAR